MVPRVMTILLIFIAAVSIAGCTTHPAGPAGTAPLPVSTTGATPAMPVSTVQAGECTRAEDCVPAECCHPSSCTAVTVKKPCNLMCTDVCEGPLDCGAGSCGCVKGKCSVVPASLYPASSGLTAIAVNTSPTRYSPIMSSTPGIGLEPVVTGFSAENATFAWKATYGHFLSWDAPDFRVKGMGSSAENHGAKIYWSFIDRPDSTATPVTITVTATDTSSGRVLGSSVVTLDWMDNFSVSARVPE